MNESEIVEPRDAPVLWDGEYFKVFYNVHLPSGEIVKCWPNAGYMNAGDGSGRMWRPEDKVLVSVADNEEFKSEVMWQKQQAARLALAMDVGVEEAVALFEAAGARRPALPLDNLAMADPERFKKLFKQYMPAPPPWGEYSNGGYNLLTERLRAKRDRRDKKRKKR